MDLFKKMEDNTDDSVDFSKLKVPELKKELKLRHLSTAGNKTELMERLLNFVKNKRDNGATMDDLEEDLLNDEEDDHLDDENDALLTDLEKTISESETPTTPKSKPQKRKLATDSNKLTNEVTTKSKRVTLTRKPTGTSESTAVTVLTEAVEVKSSKDLSSLTQNIEADPQASPEATNGATRKIIKLSKLSDQERLEMRSKKFGTPLTADATKQNRAERFGLTNDNKQPISGNGITASVDVLKQRAKRFGVSVSPSITKLENLERLEQRKNRFGGVPIITAVIIKETSTTAAKSQMDADKAKVARLERFK